MARSVVLFFALLFTALVAGGAFVIWLEYNPSGMSAAAYVEGMQHAIRVFTVPLPATVILSVVCCAASAFFARRERAGFYLLVAATGAVLAVALITVFGNIPINNQIKTWSVTAPPPVWAALSVQWWRFHTVRTIAAVCGMALLIVAVLIRRSVPRAV